VPPRSQVGAITPDQRKQIIQSSAIAGHYEKAVDRESAYEKLQARATEKASTAGAPPTPAASIAPTTGGAPTSPQPSIFGQIGSIFQPTIGPRGAVHDSMATSMVKSAARAASSQMGRQIIRGILGSFLGGTRR
jgi:hypothetical protein